MDEQTFVDFSDLKGIIQELETSYGFPVRYELLTDDSYGDIKSLTADLENINRLLPLLTTREGRANFKGFLSILAYSFLFVARDSTKRRSDGFSPIIAMVCLVPQWHSLGYDGYIHDVVRDPAYKDQGIGEALMRKAIDYARKMKMETLFLTSNSKNKRHQGAIRLYKKLGFRKRNTNFYELKLGEGV